MATGHYSAAEWVARCLIELRYKIGGAFLKGDVSLDRFEVAGGNSGNMPVHIQIVGVR